MRWSKALDIPLNDVNTIPSSAKIVTQGEGLLSYHAFWFRYDVVAHYMNHPNELGHLHKNCPMCEYPRDSPLHWLECSGDNLTPKEKTTLKRAQLDLVALNLECTRTPIQVHEEASSLDPAKKRRYLFLTGRCADLSYGQATAAQTSMARIRRIRTKYREQYNEMFPPVEPTCPPGKSILQQKETRNALLQDWQNSSPSSKEEKWKKMVTDHSRSTIDRWMRKGITENVITETYGMVKRQIYTETSHAKR